MPAIAHRLAGHLTVLAPAGDIALVRAMVGAAAQVEVANERPYRLAEQTTLFLRILRRRPALVHFPHYNAPLGFGGRFVVTIHDLFSYRFPDIHSGWLARNLNRLLITNSIGRAAAVITPSQATADDVASRFGSARQRVTPIAEAADQRFRPSRNPTAEAAWHRYFGIHPPYFFYLGQWKPYKNLSLLVRAFAQVVERQPGVQLVLAGNDPRHPEILAAASQLSAGSVVLPGHLPEDAIADLYRAAAAVVVPSKAEGFGLPVLEAMACGTPVVCGDIPVLRELADGVAIFCDPDSVESFVEGMLLVLRSDTRDQHARRGIERASQYSWQKAAEQTVAIYERVLAGRPSMRSEID